MTDALKKRPSRGPAVSETSAGGVVVKRIGGRVHIALLLTKHVRGDAWVLPKGHLEMQLGENEEQAALRESGEELGVKNLTLKRPLGSTRYNFFTERGKVTKTVHYFLIEAADEELKPQAEEGFLEAKWFTVREALKKITYATDRDIILRAVATGSKARKR
jgi:ADP-ribose pyrophosphatase YjhB (NUDIX family)